MKIKRSDITSYEPKKRFKKYHGYLIAGAAVTALSFLTTLVPCKVVEPKSSFIGVCKLPNPFANLATTGHYYYNYTNNPITGLILQFILAMLLSYGIAYLFKKLNFKRKNYKIIDYTKK
jgi:hypothetical protein